MAETSEFYIGWDVGAWNCEDNPRSRDAIVILDSQCRIVGTPWRNNLRDTINNAATAATWIAALFALCRTEMPTDARFTIAIDTPLGFSQEFVQLVNQRQHHPHPLQDSANNPYLFRLAERALAANGHTSLSAVKDMIGSQATKGIHVLSKYGMTQNPPAVWALTEPNLKVIETYPSPCRGVASVTALRANLPAVGHDDKEDALTCALVAYLFKNQRNDFANPPTDLPACEGWIWLPTP